MIKKQLFVSLLAMPLLAQAQNPVIRDQFAADPTARVFNDKVYLYPSHDIFPPEGQRQDWFCMEDYHVFSSENLTDWTDHGVIVTQNKVPWVKPDSYSMWAPDCIERNGKYYFYFPSAPKDGRGFGIGVAIADSPEGPFIPEPENIKGISGIDPCVLQASDGNAYIFWGAGRCAKLKPNMKELADDTPTETVKWGDHEFELSGVNCLKDLPNRQAEGPFAFEYNGNYYLTYPYVRENTEVLGYAMSKNPMGPYEYKGLIMAEQPNGCWTNHHSIVNYKGQWYLFCGLVDTHTTHGLLDLLNGAVSIEGELLNAYRAALVVLRREEVGVIEEIPLSLEVDDAVMVSPAAVGVFGHDDALVFIGTHRVLAHSVADNLSILPYVGICQVIVAVVFEGKRTFCLTVGQVFQTVDAHHLHLAITPLHGLLRCVVGQLLHVLLQFSAAAVAPEDVGIAVGSLQHARVDAVDALDRLRLRNERSFGVVGNGYTDGEAPSARGRSRREIEIVLPVSVDAVGCPHRVGVGAHPGHFVLRDDDAVVCPVRQVLRREDVVVLHAEPVLALPRWRHDVVRRVEVHLIIKNACGRVGRELVADDGILCSDHQWQTETQ